MTANDQSQPEKIDQPISSAQRIQSTHYLVIFQAMFPSTMIWRKELRIDMADVISEISDNIAWKRCLKRSANQLLD